MREEELRSRLQALAAAGRVAPEPAAIGAVRRRGRRKLQGGAALVLAGLLVAVGGVWLVSGAGDRRGLAPVPVPPISQPSGPPAAVAPATFVGQVGDGTSRRTAIIDARTGRVVRQVPGSERQSELAADAVVAPDLRSMYLPAGPGVASACDTGWTQVDLASGARRPAFGGLAGVGEFSLTADGRTLAYIHTTGPGAPALAQFGVSCRSELVVRELDSGRQRVWTIPPGGSVEGLQLSPDATRLVYVLGREPGGDRLLHLLPLAGTTSVTDGHDLPTGGDCPASSMLRFLDDRRLVMLGATGCDGGGYDNLLVRVDVETRRVVSAVPLGLPVEPFSLDVDRSGGRLIIAAAGKTDDQRPATVYVVRDGRPRRVPFRGDCWQADW
jgi:hypothetical protein